MEEKILSENRVVSLNRDNRKSFVVAIILVHILEKEFVMSIQENPLELYEETWKSFMINLWNFHI